MGYLSNGRQKWIFQGNDLCLLNAAADLEP